MRREELASGCAVTAVMRRAFEAIAGDEGSTRALGLMRMFVAPVMWVNFGGDFTIWNVLNGGHGVQSIPVVEAWKILGFFLFFAGTTMMFLGWQSRLGCALTAITIIILHLIVGRYYGVMHFVHHFTQVSLFSTVALAFSPCGRSFSLDRWLAIRRARAAGTPIPQERGSLWAHYAIRLVVSSIYFFGGLDKLRASYLSGAELERLFVYYFMDARLPDVAWFHPLMVVLSYLTVVAEVGLAIGLWIPRLLAPLILFGIFFHMAMFWTLEVSCFGPMMYVLYLSFVPPQRVHRAVDEVLA